MRRRQADELDALDAGDLGVRPDDVEEARHDVDLDVELAQRPHDAEHVRRRLLREGDDHTLDVEQRDELREPVGRAEDAQVLDLGAARLRLRVDEADEVDAVLGVLEDLAPQQLADVAGPDDDAVLDVREAEAGGRPRDDAAERHEGERERPRRSRSSSGRRGRAPVAAPMIQSAHVVTVTRWKTPTTSSAVVWPGALLVVVVEAVEARQDDPGRQGQEEDGELRRRRDALAGRRRR